MKRVALVMTFNGLATDIAQGIIEYVRTRQAWRLRRIDPAPAAWTHLMNWKPDGILFLTHSAAFKRRVRDTLLPAVEIGVTTRQRLLPRVGVDDEAVGRLAADHFHVRGYRQFAYVGPPAEKRWYGRLRRDGFEARLRELGHNDPPATFLVLPPCPEWMGMDSWAQSTPERKLLRWLEKLPRPTAVFADSDTIGIWVGELIRYLNLKIPHDFYVLGVDNEVLNCETVFPPLPSIQLPGRAIGYRAAEMLTRIMDAGKDGREEVLLEPIQVVTRDVSGLGDDDDPSVSAALLFIEHHAAEIISVSDVAQGAGVSRRYLELRFRKLLGRTILDEIRAAHVNRAKHLLLEADWPLDQVASASGFTSRVHFSRVFKDVAGVSPGVWRSSARGQLNRA